MVLFDKYGKVSGAGSHHMWSHLLPNPDRFEIGDRLKCLIAPRFEGGSYINWFDVEVVFKMTFPANDPPPGADALSLLDQGTNISMAIRGMISELPAEIILAEEKATWGILILKNIYPTAKF